jgi:hypothetical protein
VSAHRLPSDVKTLLSTPLLLAALLAPARQEPPAPAPAPDPFPSAWHPVSMRFYIFDGDVRGDALKKAVEGLANPEEPCRIVIGPTASGTRPDKQFLALEVSSRAAPKDVIQALRKANSRVQELEWTAFRGATEEPKAILGYGARECVIGMASEMRWFEFGGGESAFFFTPGKLDAPQIKDRYKKLYQPLGGGDLGELARFEITWHLATPLDAAAAKRAEKAIAKLPGVRSAKLDLEQGTLQFTVELDRQSTAAAAPPANEAEPPSARKLLPRFDTNPVFSALEKEHLALK